MTLSRGYSLTEAAKGHGDVEHEREPPAPKEQVREGDVGESDVCCDTPRSIGVRVESDTETVHDTVLDDFK